MQDMGMQCGYNCRQDESKHRLSIPRIGYNEYPLTLQVLKSKLGSCIDSGASDVRR